jgi:saccharopine dehydrogenase-like NADP-dependent oxidoreductase
MGRAIVRDLFDSDPNSHILIADYNLEAAEAVSRDLGAKGAAAARVEVRQADVRDANALSTLLRGSDMVINATNYYWNLQVMRAALDAGPHYADLGGLFHTTRKQLELDAEFRSADRLAVLGIGSAPGIMNVLARYAGDRLDKVESIRIYNGGVDRTPAPSVLSVGYSLLTILDESTMSPVVFEDGEFREKEPFSGEETMHFPSPVGSAMVHRVIHSEIATLPLNYRSKGLRECSFKINLEPALIERLKFLIGLGLASTDPVDVRGQKVIPRDLLQAMTSRLPQTTAPPDDNEILRVVVDGEEDGRRSRYTLDAFADADHRRGLSAVAIDTGVPPSVVSQMVVRGEIRERGVHAPETCVTPEPFFEAIAHRGMRVRVSREEPLAG